MTATPSRLDIVGMQLVGTLYARPDLISSTLTVLPKGLAKGSTSEVYIELLRKHTKGQNFDSAGFLADVERLSGWREYFKECQRYIGGGVRRVGATDTIALAEEIAEDGTRRALVEELIIATKEAENSNIPTDQLVQQIMLNLNSVSARSTGTTWRDSDEIVDATLDLIDRWREPDKTKADELGGVYTGIKKVDELVGLLPDEQVILIGGRPSAGKTALVTQIAENVGNFFNANEIDKCIAYFSAETSGTSLYLRLASGSTGVEQRTLKRGEATDDELTKVKNYLNSMRKLPVYVDETPNPTTENMLSRAMILHNMIKDGKQQRVGLLIFDFAELAGDEGEDEIKRMSRVARNMKIIAKLLKCPVIVLVQIGRQTDARKEKMPTMSDIRGSDTWTQIAYIILIPHRPSYYKRQVPGYDPEKDKDQYLAVLHLAKHKDERTGMINLAFAGERLRFYDPEDPGGGWQEYLREKESKRALLPEQPVFAPPLYFAELDTEEEEADEYEVDF